MPIQVPSFGRVWIDISGALVPGLTVETLVQRVRNRVVSVGVEGVTLVSERTGHQRTIRREQFEFVWNQLVVSGRYVSKDHQPFIHSQMICAILSLLPYVSARFGPGFGSLTLTIR
jgi:endonuclease III